MRILLYTTVPVVLIVVAWYSWGIYSHRRHFFELVTQLYQQEFSLCSYPWGVKFRIVLRQFWGFLLKKHWQLPQRMPDKSEILLVKRPEIRKRTIF